MNYEADYETHAQVDLFPSPTNVFNSISFWKRRRERIRRRRRRRRRKGRYRRRKN